MAAGMKGSNYVRQALMKMLKKAAKSPWVRQTMLLAIASDVQHLKDEKSAIKKILDKMGKNWNVVVGQMPVLEHFGSSRIKISRRPWA